MISEHRYILAGAQKTTLERLRNAVRAANPTIDFKSEVVQRYGDECGILIDVAYRGHSIFDEELLLVRERLTASKCPARAEGILNTCQCMVTTQVTSVADESVLEVIWSVLGSLHPGLLVLEDHASTIRFYE